MPAGAGTDRAALQGTVGADIRVTSVAGRRPRAGAPPPWVVIATRRLYTITFVAAHASGVHARVGAAAGPAGPRRMTVAPAPRRAAKPGPRAGRGGGEDRPRCERRGRGLADGTMVE